jgi:hypothetical protein
MKNRPFMSRSLSIIYIGTVALVQPYWILEIYANFAYFNNIEVPMYEKIRPWEALFRYATSFSPHVVLPTPESLIRTDHRLQRPLVDLYCLQYFLGHQDTLQFWDH